MMIKDLNYLLISHSLDLSDYEIIIRQRGTYEYSAYSPQLNYMAKAKDLLTAKSLLIKRINQHIRHLMENPHLIEEYNRKMEEYRRQNEDFIAANLKGAANKHHSVSAENAPPAAPLELDAALGIDKPFDEDFDINEDIPLNENSIPYDESIDYTQLPETDEANKLDMNDIMDLLK